MNEIFRYYARKDVRQQILKLAKNREIAVKYNEGFGKRPDILQYENDIYELAKNGATSFHASEERWKDPLLLKSGMSKRQLDDLRIGWDFILDIDTPFIEFSKVTAELIIEALKFHNVKNFSIKFSGGTGFHIGIPFEAFPETARNEKIKDFFPDGARIIASYIKQMIKDYLSVKILEISNLNEISKNSGKKEEELIKNDVFDPYSVVDIDTVLISSRHMFRTPYSVNEKTNLVSIPITISQLHNFKLSKAQIRNVEAELSFLDSSKIKEPEASQLLIQSLDWNASQIKSLEPNISIGRKYEIPKVAIKDTKFYPPCINNILNGLKEDGRKRSIFILINFLKQMGLNLDEIKEKLLEWNKKNYESLREGYILSQISWHKKQKQNILPPNCDSAMYYQGMAVCKPDNFCKRVKNPINYAIRKARVFKENQPKKK